MRELVFVLSGAFLGLAVLFGIIAFLIYKHA